jgi:ADP-heptose:LPS heptosyltransferase
VSRPDSLGDVVLTLPLAGLLRERLPGVRVTFLGRRYTAPVLRHCRHVDEVLTLEELAEAGEGGAARRLAAVGADAIIHVFPRRDVARWAKRAGLPLRVGTSHRWWHWLTCNRLVPVARTRSERHEARLNLELLRPLGMDPDLPLDRLPDLYGLLAPPPDMLVRSLLRPGVRRVILHPGSRGSAVEWGLPNFAALIRLLDPSRFQVLVTGTAAEAEGWRRQLPLDLPQVTEVGGLLTLDQFLSLIGACDALVAASTGPLHLAAALGKRAVGLYSPRRPIHPGRWAPLGRDAHALVLDPDCPRCRRGETCDCVTRIHPGRVLEIVQTLPPSGLPPPPA